MRHRLRFCHTRPTRPRGLRITFPKATGFAFPSSEWRDRTLTRVVPHWPLAQIPTTGITAKQLASLASIALERLKSAQGLGSSKSRFDVFSI
jgi:hypothetical protein